MTFGTIIRSASCGQTHPNGIGGDANVIWHAGGKAYGWAIQERSVIDFSHIRHRAAIPPISAMRIGGNQNIIWYSEEYNRICELAPSNFSIIKYLSGPGSVLYGIGGNESNLYVTRRFARTLYKLNVNDASTIKSAPSPSTRPSGIGGTGLKIWHTDLDSDTNYYLNPSDFSVIQSAPCTAGPTGIGGDDDTIYYCDIITDRIYEIETPTPSLELFPITITQIGPL